jgi:N-acetylneuraminic acid mutarotase
MKMHFGNLVALVAFALIFPFEPARAATWTTNGPMATLRLNATATLLLNGKVLVAGGFTNSSISGNNVTNDAELYDPATGKWTKTGSLNIGRALHTATLLPNGKVLIAGGQNASVDSHNLASAELFDPANGMWTLTGTMTTNRANQTATLLPNGKVLIVGGTRSLGVPPASTALSTAELFDPNTGTWTSTGAMNYARENHTATLLPNGQVLVAWGDGGINSQGLASVIAACELYDPSTQIWTSVGTYPVSVIRHLHTATLLPNGKVLMAGGLNYQGTLLSSVELYDSASGAWSAANSMNIPRYLHTATLLPNGQLLVAGGLAGIGLTNVEVFNPATGIWTATNGLNTTRYLHTATLLANGKVLAAGGLIDNSSEVYDPAVNPATGTWANTGGLHIARDYHTATLLPSGAVLVAGGNATGTSMETYDPIVGIWTSIGSLTTARNSHTATLLPNGKVLLAGGADSGNNLLASTELYDPIAGTNIATGSLAFPHGGHTATLLPNGKVLVAGGGNGWSSDAEIYDPVAGIWTDTTSLNTARYLHTATLIANGKVLVAGGDGFTGFLTSAELYDPASGTWTTTGSLNTGRDYHTETLLPNGKVLVAGGYNGSFLSSAEIYDPATGAWTRTGTMNTARFQHTATLLPNGKVLVAGGENSSGALTNAELYDPSLGTWTTNRTLKTARFNHTATLLPNGKMLIAGGYKGNYLTNAELYDVGLGYTNTSQPQITSITTPLNLNSSLVVAGAQFRGVAEGSGGNSQDSSTDYPLVQLRNLESGQTVFLSSTNWGTNFFTSLPVWNFPPGYALATVFVNGIQSSSSIVNISVPIPTAPKLTGEKKQTNGAFSFAFTNSVGALFGVLAAINLSLPQTNWTALGGVTEISPGQFQFTDPQATNSGQRFYQIRSP